MTTTLSLVQVTKLRSNMHPQRLDEHAVENSGWLSKATIGRIPADVTGVHRLIFSFVAGQVASEEIKQQVD